MTDSRLEEIHQELAAGGLEGAIVAQVAVAPDLEVGSVLDRNQLNSSDGHKTSASGGKNGDVDPVLASSFEASGGS